MEPRRRHYVRLFSNLYNVDLAIRLLNEGYTYKFVAQKLKCDRSSVVSFRQKKEKEGVFFKSFGRRKSKEPPPEEGPIIVASAVVQITPTRTRADNINLGKDCYADYLKEGNEKVRKIREERLEKAREVIRKVREQRKLNGIIDDPGPSYWGWGHEI